MGGREKTLQDRLWALNAKQARLGVLQALCASSSEVIFLDLRQSDAFAGAFRERDVGPHGPHRKGSAADFWACTDIMWRPDDTIVLLLNTWQKTGFAKLSYGLLRSMAQSLQQAVGADIFIADPSLERGAVLDVGETDTLLRFWGKI
jgi:hypothetical protein